MYGLPRPWYFPFQKSYWLGNGRTETWEWTWPWSRTTRLSVMEEDQACAMENRRLGETEKQNCPIGWLGTVWKHRIQYNHNLSLCNLTCMVEG